MLLNYKPKEKQEDISDDDFFKKFEEMRKKELAKINRCKNEIGVFEMTDKKQILDNLMEHGKTTGKLTTN